MHTKVRVTTNTELCMCAKVNVNMRAWGMEGKGRVGSVRVSVLMYLSMPGSYLVRVCNRACVCTLRGMRGQRAYLNRTS